jgi:hypothetical protein
LNTTTRFSSDLAALAAIAFRLPARQVSLVVTWPGWQPRFRGRALFSSSSLSSSDSEQ